MLSGPPERRRKRFLSTLPARGATGGTLPEGRGGSISIHAPREGSDWRGALAPAGAGDFYPRSPRGERPITGRSEELYTAFLSTLPARGATGRTGRNSLLSDHFYPRSPRGERRPASRHGHGARPYFYPRSPRGERHTWSRNPGHDRLFLSTLPARGATPRRCNCAGNRTISIHAPREGSDAKTANAEGDGDGISIHAPREGSDPAYYHPRVF